VSYGSIYIGKRILREGGGEQSVTLTVGGTARRREGEGGGARVGNSESSFTNNAANQRRNNDLHSFFLTVERDSLLVPGRAHNFTHVDCPGGGVCSLSPH